MTRVRRCALANLIYKGRNSSMVIYCFDAWRMLMYCRMQHDLGREEKLIQHMQYEKDIAAYQQQLEFVEQKRNQEREVLLQMIAMLHNNNTQLQSTYAHQHRPPQRDCGSNGEDLYCSTNSKGNRDGGGSGHGVYISPCKFSGELEGELDPQIAGEAGSCTFADDGDDDEVRTHPS